VLDLLYHISDFNHVKLLSHIFNLYQEWRIPAKQNWNNASQSSVLILYVLLISILS
jgi:hypothetical protein